MSIKNDVLVNDLLRESVESAAARADGAFMKILEDDFSRPVVLHGAGNLGRRTARSMQTNHVNLVAFSDVNPSLAGTFVEGLPIFSIEEAGSRYGEECVCVISVVSPGVGRAYVKVADRLHHAGFKRVVPFSLYAWRYSDGLLPYYCIDRPEKILASQKAIREACVLLTDSVSRRVFAEQLSVRLHANFEELEPQSADKPYFPACVIERLNRDAVVVDCGAFDGDTLEDYVSIIGLSGKGCYYAFEPDADNYAKLCCHVDSLPLEVKSHVVPMQKAVGSRAELVRFDGGTGMSSAVSDAGGIAVDCTTIDSIIDGGPCSLIKMDIEGFEAEALAGARETIVKSKPVLAISAYHKPNDFFELMLQIRAMNSDYEFFMDRHECDIWDVVLYAV